MHSPITHMQLVEALVLLVEGFLLWYGIAAMRYLKPWMRVVYRVMGALCGLCGGMLIGQWAMFGMKP